MVYKRPEQRVVVLIDTQNMYHSAKHLYGAHLNFGRLVEMIVGNRSLTRAIAYVATSKGGEEKGFLGALVASGIDLRSKDVIEFASGERKADWDVGMAIDAVRMSDKVDCVVLVTGDGDFVPLVEYLQNRGVIVEVAAFAESTSKMLREAADEYFDISSHPDELLLIAGSRRTPSHGTEADDVFEEEDEEDAPKRKKPLTGSGKGAGGRKIRVTV